MEYKQTLNMGKSGFPMRAGLPKREPDMLKGWYDMDLYHKMIARNEGKPEAALPKIDREEGKAARLGGFNHFITVHSVMP